MENKYAEEDEYMLAYYGISVPAIIQGMNDSFKTTIEKFVNVIKEEYYQVACPTKMELYNSVFDNLYKEYTNNCQEIMILKEKELRNMLKIPSHIVLPQDKYKEYSSEDLNKLKGEIKELEEKYAKEKAYNYACKKEVEILEQLTPIRDKINNAIAMVGHLENHGNAKFDKLVNAHNAMSDAIIKKAFGDTMDWRFVEDE